MLPAKLIKHLHPKVSVVHCDSNGVFVVEKPAGLICHPNRSGVALDSIFRLPYDLRRRAYILDGQPIVYLLNRIDSATSGLVLLSTSAEIAVILRRLFEAQAVKKVYYAYVFSEHSVSSGIWRDSVSEFASENHLRLKSSYSGAFALTQVSSLAKIYFNGISMQLLQMQPLTGRTHQLRLQCSKRKIPIVNDKVYGDFSKNKNLYKFLKKKDLLLKSAEIHFTYAFCGRTFSFSAVSPMASSFCEIFRNHKS